MSFAYTKHEHEEKHANWLFFHRKIDEKMRITTFKNKSIFICHASKHSAHFQLKKEINNNNNNMKESFFVWQQKKKGIQEKKGRKNETGIDRKKFSRVA